jgi:uncharacterized protein YhhL (DUF1145 family)
MDFVGFMRSTTGRALRVVVGVVLVLLALVGPWASTALNVILLILGIVLILVGALNYCLLAPLFGKSIKTGR